MPPKAAASGTQKITTFFSVKKPSTASAEKSPKKPATPSSSNGKSENPNKRKRESVNLELSDDSDGCASPIITRSKSTPTKSPVATSSSTPSKSTTSTTPTKSSASKATSSTSKSTPTKSTPTKSTVTLKNKSTPTKSVKDEDWSDDDRDFAKKVVNKVTPTKPPVVAQKNTKVIVDDDDDDTLSSQDVVSSPSTKKRKTSSPFSKSPKVEKVKEEKPKTTPKKEVKKEEKKKETKKKDDDDEEKPAETKKRGFYNKAQHENKQKAKNPGCKKVPVGKSNCLKDKSFVITGQMESLDREEMEDLIKQYGGVIRVSVSGRTSFVIVGEEPGESKMKKVREHNTKQLSEDDLLEMIAKSNPSGQDSMDESDDEANPPQKFIPPPRPNVVTSSTTQVIKSKNGDDQLWVEKYKPSSSSQIIGHNKECGLLLTWLKDWHTNLEKEIQAASAQTKGRKKATSEWKRAAFLSGPPGIGKSTSAALIAREAGYTNIVELNASDSRSKKAMKEQIVESCLSNNINNYFQKKGQQKSNDKQQTIVIMDEVDGMSSGDRGGVVELVQIIKQTRVPVICIANDRSKISLKTLITHCLDLKFSRPSKATITKKLLEVCKKENLSIDNNALEYMVESLNNDIRSVLNNLQLINRYSSKDHIGYMDAKNSDLTKTSSTDGIFDVVKDVLGQNTKKYNERLEDFYFDPMLVPLFVEQNYINIRPPGDDKERIQRISYASDAISMGDMVNSKIRKEMSFGLMNTHAFYSTMYPAYFIRGSFQPLRGYDKYYQFPAVLGKGSTTTKNYNALKTIQKTTSLKASADTLEMLDYLPLLSKTLLNPLVNGGKDVQETIEAMDEYQISRDDLEFMCELSTFKGKNLSEENKDWFSEIDTKTKTALTRQYNKAHKGFNKVSAAAALSKVEDEDNIEAEEEDEEDDLKADKFVTKMKNIAKLEAFEKKRDKVEKKTTKKTTKKETTKKESTKKEVKKETEKKPLVLKKK